MIGQVPKSQTQLAHELFPEQRLIRAMIIKTDAGRFYTQASDQIHKTDLIHKASKTFTASKQGTKDCAQNYPNSGAGA